MIKEILDKEFYTDGLDGFYLTTGRTLAHYNNDSQTKHSKKLWNNHSKDTLLASVEDEGKFGDKMDELIMTARFKSLHVSVIPQ
ncbi:NAD-dependent formate dehydrogenase alpha subunit [hydrothermal vent metagenome]|uniref:NAD-dependent formate dehydrogenase alpha subunit n=1 Tax=hydrothermal vent metagenome TaxID=652676 RepID=A0A1W1C960_9ZZZZ